MDNAGQINCRVLINKGVLAAEDLRKGLCKEIHKTLPCVHFTVGTLRVRVTITVSRHAIYVHILCQIFGLNFVSTPQHMLLETYRIDLRGIKKRMSFAI